MHSHQLQQQSPLVVILKTLLCFYLLRICDGLTIAILGYSFGKSVSTAGDVNGDGYDDILIGTDGDGVYVIYGNSTFSLQDIDFNSITLDPASTGFALRGEAEHRWFGTEVSAAGDVNGDGFDDLIIGASGMPEYRGSVYVIYGNSTSSLNDIDLRLTALNPAETGFVIRLNTDHDQFGWSVSAAGDVNGDGYDDVIVGASGKVDSRGAGYVIYGNSTSSLKNIDLNLTSLDPAETGFVIRLNANHDRFGWFVSAAGDVNGDGYDDMIVKTSNQDSQFYVIYGNTTSSLKNIDLALTTLDPASTGFTLRVDLSDTFMAAVATAGDVNGDGYDDILIGTHEDKAYVVYGNSTSSLQNIDFNSMTLNPASTGFVIRGEVGYCCFGRAVGAAGDVNGDGYDDLIIGASGESGYRGAAYVIYGNSTSSLKNIYLTFTPLDPAQTGFAIRGNSRGDTFGRSVGTAGDVNGDGFDDIFIGADREGGHIGAVFAVYGNATSSLKNLNLAYNPLDPSSTGFTLKGRKYKRPSWSRPFNTDL